MFQKLLLSSVAIIGLTGLATAADMPLKAADFRIAHNFPLVEFGVAIDAANTMGHAANHHTVNPTFQRTTRS